MESEVSDEESSEETNEVSSEETSEEETNDEDDIISDRTLANLEGLVSAAEVEVLNLTKRQIRDFVYKNEGFDDVSSIDFSDEDDTINPDSISMIKAVLKTANDGNFDLSTGHLNQMLNNLKAK
jgi:hypothetical protein